MTKITYEKLDPKRCSGVTENKILSKEKWESNTSILFTDVTITDVWAYYDGPLFGICEINGDEFFFHDVIFDCWRHYDVMWSSNNTPNKWWQESRRLGAVYGVLDIDIEEAKETIGDRNRSDWQSDLTEISDYIGIFIDYTKGWS